MALRALTLPGPSQRLNAERAAPRSSRLAAISAILHDASALGSIPGGGLTGVVPVVCAVPVVGGAAVPASTVVGSAAPASTSCVGVAVGPVLAVLVVAVCVPCVVPLPPPLPLNASTAPTSPSTPTMAATAMMGPALFFGWACGAG